MKRDCLIVNLTRKLFSRRLGQNSIGSTAISLSNLAQSNGKREFVISAGGIKSAFPAVEALYAKAPVLSHWTWVRFRPRQIAIHDLNYGNKRVGADDVHYLPTKDGDKGGILLFFDGYSDSENQRMARSATDLLTKRSENMR